MEGRQEGTVCTSRKEVRWEGFRVATVKSAPGNHRKLFKSHYRIISHLHSDRHSPSRIPDARGNPILIVQPGQP
jgi:hypothetical protein